MFVKSASFEALGLMHIQSNLSFYPVCFFFFTLPLFKVDSAGLLCEEVKQCPVLHDKQMKGVREKDVLSVVWNARTKDLEYIENGKSNLI